MKNFKFNFNSRIDGSLENSNLIEKIMRKTIYFNNLEEKYWIFDFYVGNHLISIVPFQEGQKEIVVNID